MLPPEKDKSDYNALQRENEALLRKLEEAEQTLHAIRDGEVDALVVQDNKKSTIRHIVDQEVLTQSILEQVADIVVICDNAGTILRASRNITSLYPQGVAGEQFDSIFSLYDHKDCSVDFRNLVERRSMKGYELLSKYPAGGRIAYFMLSTSPLYSVDEEFLGLVVTLTDITNQKRSEALLRRADTRKDEFLAMLAHELRNPLAPLQNALDLMDMVDEDDLHDKAKKIMGRQMKQIIRLVDDLLDVSRITRDTIELRKETLKFSEVIKNTLEICRPLMVSQNHNFTVNLPDEEVYLKGDLIRLSQAFSNVLNNAAKYTPPGGDITLSTEVWDGYLLVMISDDGIGIDPSMTAEVFEMFVQVDTSLERSHGGLGIGLTLVKKLVALHGGKVTVYSEGLGKGSLFTVSLPVLEHIGDGLEPKERVFAEASRKRRIMVLDDNQESAETIGIVLRHLGHEFDLSFNSMNFLERVRDYRPDVILMDIGMPGKNGYELCREIRQSPDLSEIIMIAQTGWGQKRDYDMAKKAGFDHHLVKPIDINNLQDILNSYLD